MKKTRSNGEWDVKYEMGDSGETGGTWWGKSRVVPLGLNVSRNDRKSCKYAGV